MGTPRDALIAQLEKISLHAQVLNFILVFEFSIEMEATSTLHFDVFSEFVEYMETYMDKCTI